MTCSLKPDDITYIFDFAEVDSIIVDKEYESLLDDFKKSHPSIPFIIDLVSRIGSIVHPFGMWANAVPGYRCNRRPALWAV
jgi:hypothetical protein